MAISKIVQNSLSEQISLGVKVATINVANSTYHVKDDTAVNVGGGYIVITGSGFASGAQVLIDNVAATSVSVVNDTTIRAQVPARTAGTYVVYVVNSDGGVGIRVNGLTYSTEPTWVTSSTLSDISVDDAISFQLEATGASTYSLQTGSTLPTGLSLAANGLVSGTVTGLETETLYNFTIEAIDSENQESPRAFNITVTVGEPYFKYTTLLLDGDGTDGANNNVILDSSSNNFAITRNGNSTQGSFTPFSPDGWSNYFDGSGDYLQPASSNTVLQISSSSQSFTVEAWIYPVNINSSGPQSYRFTSIISKGVVYTSFGYTSTGILRWYTYDGSENYVESTTGIVVPNQWQHVAIVSNGGAITLYRNGVSVATGTLVVPSGATDLAPKIGAADTAAGTDYLRGYLSNLRVNTTAVYTSGFTPSTSALTAISGTQLLTCQSKNLIDNSTNNYTILRAGEVRTSNFSPLKPTAAYSKSSHGGSIYFDGGSDYLSVPSDTAFNLGTSDFTIQFWAWLQPYTYSSSTYWAQVIGINTGSTSDANQAGSAIGIWQADGTGTSSVAGEFTVIANSNEWRLHSGISGYRQWTHVALTRASNVFRLYQNGVLRDSATHTTNFTNSLGQVIGRSASSYLVGYVSDLQVIKGTALYTGSSFSLPTSPATAVSGTSLLLSATNAGISDLTTRNVIETSGPVNITTTSPKFGTGCITFADDSALRIAQQPHFALRGNFTIEFWIKFTVTSTDGGPYRRVIDFGGGNSAGAFQLLISTTSSEYSTAGAGAIFPWDNLILIDEFASSGSPMPAVNDGNWHHIAIVREGTALKSYTDGTYYNTRTVSDTQYWDSTGNVNPLTIGGVSTNTATGNFVGQIDDLRITNYARYTGTSNYTVPSTKLPVR